MVSRSYSSFFHDVKVYICFFWRTSEEIHDWRALKALHLDAVHVQMPVICPVRAFLSSDVYFRDWNSSLCTVDPPFITAVQYSKIQTNWQYPKIPPFRSRTCAVSQCFISARLTRAAWRASRTRWRRGRRWTPWSSPAPTSWRAAARFSSQLSGSTLRSIVSLHVMLSSRKRNVYE